MIARPQGTVTFLFTDIEQSTRRWEENPEAMRAALARHDAVLKEAIESSDGWLFKHTGDGVLAAFASARSAVDAGVTALRRLELPVRMAIGTGEVESRGDDYFGPVMNLAARSMAAGHGGQLIITSSTAAMVAGIPLVELGEHRLRDIAQPQRLYQVQAEGLRRAFPPLNTLSTLPGNIPAQSTSFLGRENDVAEVVGLLSDARMVTLTGVGGVGKTRLAVHAATEAWPRHRDGAWMVELAGVGEPAALAHAVAAALDVMQQPGKSVEQSIVASLNGRRTLLVLDNCEHLIEAAASLAHEIVTHCPEVTILATSREALMIDGERIWPVPSLGFRDGAASPAVELFRQRARAIAPDFEFGTDADAVSEICRRLDGIPLAIELAAARIRSMSPSQICTRLDERFRLLTGGSRRAIERHQTLRHTVQWSFDLLSPTERAVLCRAAVFANGFNLEAAERVCTKAERDEVDILDVLDSLVRKSLVTVHRAGDLVRYGMLETIRQFAEESLAAMGEGDDTRRRHADWFADDSDEHFRVWRSPQEIRAYEWLDREMDNVRVAFRWASDHQHIDIAARIASSIGDMARIRLRQEAADWAAEILEDSRRLRHRRLVILLSWAASSAWSFGRLDEAKRHGEEAIRLMEEPGFDPFAWVFTDLAQVALYESDVDRAMAVIQQGAEHAADRHDRFCLAMLPAYFAASRRDEEAIEAANRCVPIVEVAGYPTSIVLAYYAKGMAFARKDPAVALASLERAVAVARQCGNRLFGRLAISQMAILQALRGDPTTALQTFRKLLSDRRSSADMLLLANSLGGLTILFARLGSPSTSATLHGAMGRIGESEVLVDALPETVERIRGELGVAVFEQESRRGAAMTLEDAIRYAQEQIGLALAAQESVEG